MKNDKNKSKLFYVQESCFGVTPPNLQSMNPFVSAMFKYEPAHEMLKRELQTRFTQANVHDFYVIIERLPDFKLGPAATPLPVWKLHGISFNKQTVDWVMKRTWESVRGSNYSGTFAVLTVKVQRDDYAALLQCNEWFLY